MKHLALLLATLAACAMPTDADPTVEAQADPQALTTSFTTINSNIGSPLCPITGGQCNATSARGARAHRMLRTWAMSIGQPTSNFWACAPTGLVCNKRVGSPLSAFLTACTPSGDLRCTFGTTVQPNMGEVRIDSFGRAANFFYNNGSIGQSNPAGHVFHLTTGN